MDPLTNRTIPINMKTFLFGKQYRKLISHPTHVVQLAHYISRKFASEHNLPPLEIYADVRTTGGEHCSLIAFLFSFSTDSMLVKLPT